MDNRARDQTRGVRPRLLVLLSVLLIAGAFLYGVVSDAEFGIGIVLGVALFGVLILIKALASEVD